MVVFRVLAAGLFLAVFSFQSASALSIDLSRFLVGEAVSARVDLHGIQAKGDRCHLDVTLSAPRLWSDLDAKARARGNLNSSRNRLYWVGPTRFRGIEGGNTVLLTSRARYESWAIVKVFGSEIKNKNFQDTKTVDFLLRPRWDAAGDRLSLDYEIQNVRNFPGEIERVLKRSGVEFGGSANFRVPRDDAMQQLDPRIEVPLAFSPTPNGNGLAVRTVVSLTLPPVEVFLGLTVDTCITLKGLLETIPDKAAALAIGLIARL